MKKYLDKILRFALGLFSTISLLSVLFVIGAILVHIGISAFNSNGFIALVFYIAVVSFFVAIVIGVWLDRTGGLREYK